MQDRESKEIRLSLLCQWLETGYSHLAVVVGSAASWAPQILRPLQQVLWMDAVAEICLYRLSREQKDQDPGRGGTRVGCSRCPAQQELCSRNIS